jgi:hypothetical protein
MRRCDGRRLQRQHTERVRMDGDFCADVHAAISAQMGVLQKRCQRGTFSNATNATSERSCIFPRQGRGALLGSGPPLARVCSEATARLLAHLLFLMPCRNAMGTCAQQYSFQRGSVNKEATAHVLLCLLFLMLSSGAMQYSAVAH